MRTAWSACATCGARGIGVAVDGDRAVARARAVRITRQAISPRLATRILRKLICGVQFALRFCRKAVVPSMPSGPSAARENACGRVLYERRPGCAQSRHAPPALSSRRARRARIAGCRRDRWQAPRRAHRRRAPRAPGAICSAAARVDAAAGDRQALGLGIAEPLDEEGRDLRRHHAERGLRAGGRRRCRAAMRDVGDAGEAEAAAHAPCLRALR